MYSRYKVKRLKFVVRGILLYGFENKLVSTVVCEYGGFCMNAAVSEQ